MMSSREDHPVGLLESPPTRHLHFSPLQRSPAQGGFHFSPRMRPPLNVVVIHEPPTGARVSSLGANFHPARTTIAGGPPPNAFRLKPRNPVKSVPLLPSARTRKRRAHSISDSTVSSDNTSDTGTLTGLLPAGLEALPTPGAFTTTSSQAESPRRVGNTVITLQGLSIQSPRATRQTPERRSNGESPSMFAGSQQSTIRSSFSKFAASPPSSLRFGESPLSSNETPFRRPRAMSAASSTKSSPKFAPLTVISHRDMVSTPASQRTQVSNRPPLHGGASALMFSLDGASQESEEVDDTHVFATPRRLPPQVLCPNSNSSDVSTLHEPIATPSSKQARTSDFHSPSMRSYSGFTPRTPLPKVTLTPRSSGTGSRGGGFPIFPSPAGDQMPPMSLFTETAPIASPFIGHSNGSEPDGLPVGADKNPPNSISLAFSIDSVGLPRRVPKSRPNFAHSSPSGESYIPIPSWSDTMPSDDTTATSATGKPPLLQAKSQSLLARSSSPGTCQSMMNEGERNADMDVENGSLSGSDDEEPFLLAAPGIIVEEKMQANSRRSRQRRTLCAPGSLEPPRPPTMPAMASQESAVSLVGMTFISSNPNLFNMERGSSSGSVGRVSGGSMMRTESMSSIGLALEGVSSSSGSDDMGGRDLITPPVMMQSEVPPSLSPRGNHSRHEHQLGPDAHHPNQTTDSQRHVAITNLAYARMILHSQPQSPPDTQSPQKHL